MHIYQVVKRSLADCGLCLRTVMTVAGQIMFVMWQEQFVCWLSCWETVSARAFVNNILSLLEVDLVMIKEGVSCFFYLFFFILQSSCVWEQSLLTLPEHQTQGSFLRVHLSVCLKRFVMAVWQFWVLIWQTCQKHEMRFCSCPSQKSSVISVFDDCWCHKQFLAHFPWLETYTEKGGRGGNIKCCKDVCLPVNF